MPCSDGGWNDNGAEEINRLTALLCEACHNLPKESMSKDLLAWWEKHEAADKIRRRKQAERNELKRIAETAMNKLSTEEVEALRSTGLLVKKK